MMASITKNTWQQYEKPIRLWWTNCREKRLSMFNPHIPDVLEFFAAQLQVVNSYSTLNIYRSAISLLMSNSLGKDPEISRFFKGAANEKPRKARYSRTWDPSIVLNHLHTWFPNETLSLERLTKKLTTLLALSTAQRVQTLALIKISNINKSENLIRIEITDKIKTSKYMAENPVLEIPFFSSRPSVCPAKTLVAYLQKTEDLRPAGEDRMFITFKKPHHAATTQSISRWIKNTLAQSGIDIGTFSAHSTRHASTSAAARNGASIEVIKRTAGWSRNSRVFAEFYNRPLLDEQQFAESIIQ